MRHAKWRPARGSVLVILLLMALGIAACGPESTRQRNGGLGGSSRPSAPPTTISEPALVVQPTTNIPYATAGALPTLPALPTATTGPATPPSQPSVPTPPTGPSNPGTPGLGGTPRP
ncbi:MAG TPA: hypothetical protein VIL85_08465 [Thermomicrobiales bacterium]|jgi:hypothetical protein